MKLPTCSSSLLSIVKPASIFCSICESATKNYLTICIFFLLVHKNYSSSPQAFHKTTKNHSLIKFVKEVLFGTRTELRAFESYSSGFPSSQVDNLNCDASVQHFLAVEACCNNEPICLFTQIHHR